MRDPNPDNLPQFLDYYFVREGGNLSIQVAPFLRETEEEVRPEFEKMEGFVGWLSQVDINSFNQQ